MIIISIFNKKFRLQIIINFLILFQIITKTKSRHLIKQGKLRKN